MPLILRAVKGSKLTITEMDGNLVWLAGNISGSGVIPVTGSSINASNTPITSSFFVGDGSKVTGVISSSYAATASYSRTLIANVTNPEPGLLRFFNSANTTIASITDLTASLATTASYSTTLGAALGNDATGQLRLLNSANSTLSVISKLTASLAVTSSYVNPLRQIVQITGSLLVSNSIDSSNRVLYDSTGFDSIDWQNRSLKDTTGNNTVEWTDNLFLPSTDDTVELGSTGNRFRAGYISRTFVVGDPSGPKTTIANFTRDGVSDYVGSITLSTGSGAPTIAGGEGQMFVGKAGANYYIYVYIGGQWRSSSLT